jgi:methyl-accepting chemotaxis protein
MKSKISYTPAPQPPAQVSSPVMPRIRTSFRRRGSMWLDLPIAGRLTIGFLAAAFLATLVTGLIGLQRSQSLDQQSSFYQKLLSQNTSLNSGNDFLQLMNTELHQTLSDATVAQPSQETLGNDQKALQGLTSRYDTVLNDYTKYDLLKENADELSILNDAGNSSTQVLQQQTLVGSANRTWQVYRSAQSEILGDILSGTSQSLAEAQTLIQTQGEPTNADAQSALRTLIQFNGSLAQSIQTAALVEEQSLALITAIVSVLTFLGIILIGWFISGTLVRRLRELRRVTQAVERGKLDERVTVIGSDEIADVSDSVNAMLDALLALVEETRKQRDVLTNAAEHLFSNMRVVSSGDLRISAPVSNDPIGMLANAFNFTVGRFRRFVMHTHSAGEQLDVLTQHANSHTEHFVQAMNKLMMSASQQGERTNSGSLRSITNKDLVQELSRLSLDFAQEIAATGRKLAAITNDMRQTTAAFQLDLTGANELSPQDQQLPSPSPAQSRFQSSPLRYRRH